MVGQLCGVCHAATRPSHRRQRRGPQCRRTWSDERPRARSERLKAFCLPSTAHHAPRVVRGSSPTAYRAVTACRQPLAARAAAEKRPRLGERALDESSVGGRRKGPRGRGAAGNVAAVGIPERAGKVDPVAVPDGKTETLRAKRRAATVKGAAFYTDELVRSNGGAPFGTHVPVNHRATFAEGAAHINGSDGSWSFARCLYRHAHGVDREHVPRYRQEYESRYNHREEHRLTSRFEALIRPQLQEDGLA